MLTDNIKEIYERLLNNKPVYFYSKYTGNLITKRYLVLRNATYNYTLNKITDATVSINFPSGSVILGDVNAGNFKKDPDAFFSMGDHGIIVSFSKLSNKQRKGFKSIDRKKFPVSRTKNYVGVELELLCPVDSIQDLKNLFILNNLASKIEVGYDGSIESMEGDPIDVYAEHQSFEIRVIDTEENITNTIKQVTKLLKNVKAFTNASCGLHVHLDMRNRNAEKSFKKLIDHLPYLKKKVNPSRLYNEYCEINPENDTYEGGKYRAISPCKRLNTIEVRLHEGTLDSKKINKWIKSLTNILKSDKIPKKKAS